MCLLTVTTLIIIPEIDLTVGLVIVFGRLVYKCSRTGQKKLIPHLAEIMEQGLTALVGLLLVHLVVTKQISPTGIAFNFVQWTHLMEEVVNSASIYKSKI